MNGTDQFAHVDTSGVLEKGRPANQGKPDNNDYGIPSTGAMQVRTQYSTAVHVIKPRNLQEVLRKCLEEAAIAGEDFYYSWKQGGEIIEGLTIGCATAMVRNFGNCAVDCRVEDFGSAYLYYAAFIDLETGFNLVRPFRQSKEGPKKKDGTETYKGDRGKDIVFQIGVSKATRNVALNAVPKWLSEKVFDKAKENVTKKIADMGIEKARIMVSKKAAAIGIPLPRIEMIYGKEASWDIEGIVQISSALRAVEDGIESVDSLFPIKGSEPKPEVKDDPKATPAAEGKSEKVNEAQIKRLYTLATQFKWTKPEVHERLKEAFGFESTKELSQVQYDAFCQIIETEIPPSKKEAKE